MMLPQHELPSIHDENSDHDNGLPTTKPPSSGDVRRAHGRFEVQAMDDDTDSVASTVSFEEVLKEIWAHPRQPHWLSPHIRHVWQISFPVSRVSSFEVPTIRMDVDDSPSHSLVGALVMSSPEERGFIVLWPDQDGESDGASVVSGEAPDVEVVETFDVPAEIQLSPVLREALRRLDRIDFGDDFLQESSGDEDSASFFERAQQECNAHRHDRGHV